METPEQQRRSSIGQSAQKLRQLGLDFDAVDLADMIWLAQFVELEEAVRLEEVTQPSSESQSSVTTSQIINTAPSEPEATIYVDEQSQSSSQSQPEQTEESEKPKGMPFPVPATPALRTRLDLARSLKPLMRKVPFPNRYDLNEEATVNQYAETQLLIPVVRSQPERWLDLDLVIEDSKTTVIWERAIAELHQVMEYQGAFRTVRTWRLSVADPKTAKPTDVKLFPRWRDRPENRNSHRPRNPRELIDPSGRRLLLVVTDCTSLLWRRGIIHETLWNWADVQPVSIMQLFPERLWNRTALSDGYKVRLKAIAPGLPSARLDVEGLPNLQAWQSDEWDSLEEDVVPDGETNDDDPRLLTLPIVTLNPVSMNAWAKVIAGAGETHTLGRTFDLGAIRQIGREYQETATMATLQRTARQRVALFRATASETAQTLAEYLAAAPVSMPVIDLLRDEFVPEARQEHVAEVLLSGLLQRCEGEEEKERCWYRFFGDGEALGSADAEETINQPETVRNLLLDSVPSTRSVQVLDALSQRIKDKAGNTLKSFEAFLAAFAESGEVLGEGTLLLAKVGLEVLQRLGGRYATLAEQYVSVVQVPERSYQSQRGTENDFPLEDIEYEVAQFVNFPPLQTCEYQSATITAILDRFDFETATVTSEILPPIGDARRSSINIYRPQASAWGYTEPLGTDPLGTNNDEEISIDMIAIPAGRFIMGAPEHEPESSDDERPQHEVTLQSFYMGRYPITQAQWRVVAWYDQVDRELDPDPSNFKGDNRPVECVSWDEAQEFCKRLSRKTGKDYRLPSEAQREYACRAGTTTPFHFGEIITTELANYDGKRTYNSSPKGEYREGTTEVGSFPGNVWGLHDMHGNVWEWCEDEYHRSYEGAPSDGSAWIGRDRLKFSRIRRGGSWYDSPGLCRSAFRNVDACISRTHLIGFRVCCVPPRILS